MAAISGPDRSRSMAPIKARGLCDSGTRSLVMIPALEYRHGRSPGSRQAFATPCRAALISTSVSLVRSGSVTVMDPTASGRPARAHRHPGTDALIYGAERSAPKPTSGRSSVQ